MKKSLIYNLLLIVFSVTLLGACDTKKEERALMLQELSTAESDLSRLNDRRNQVSNKNNQLKTEIAQLSANLNQRTQRHAKLKDSLAEYLLEHKLVTAAIVAMGGAAAGVVNENTDQETKDALTVVGVIGGAICLFNAGECADVTSRIVYFGSEIESESKFINSVTAEISGKKSSLQQGEKEYIAVSNQITEKTGVRDALKQKHDSMLCSYCI